MGKTKDKSIGGGKKTRKGKRQANKDGGNDIGEDISPKKKCASESRNVTLTTDGKCLTTGDSSQSLPMSQTMSGKFIPVFSKKKPSVKPSSTQGTSVRLDLVEEKELVFENEMGHDVVKETGGAADSIDVIESETAHGSGNVDKHVEDNPRKLVHEESTSEEEPLGKAAVPCQDGGDEEISEDALPGKVANEETTSGKDESEGKVAAGCQDSGDIDVCEDVLLTRDDKTESMPVDLRFEEGETESQLKKSNTKDVIQSLDNKQTNEEKLESAEVHPEEQDIATADFESSVLDEIMKDNENIPVVPACGDVQSTAENVSDGTEVSVLHCGNQVSETAQPTAESSLAKIEVAQVPDLGEQVARVQEDVTEGSQKEDRQLGDSTNLSELQPPTEDVKREVLDTGMLEATKKSVCVETDQDTSSPITHYVADPEKPKDDGDRVDCSESGACVQVQGAVSVDNATGMTGNDKTETSPCNVEENAPPKGPAHGRDAACSSELEVQQLPSECLGKNTMKEDMGKEVWKADDEMPGSPIVGETIASNAGSSDEEFRNDVVESVLRMIDQEIEDKVTGGENAEVRQDVEDHAYEVPTVAGRGEDITDGMDDVVLNTVSPRQSPNKIGSKGTCNLSEKGFGGDDKDETEKPGCAVTEDVKMDKLQDMKEGVVSDPQLDQHSSLISKDDLGGQTSDDIDMKQEDDLLVGESLKMECGLQQGRKSEAEGHQLQDVDGAKMDQERAVEEEFTAEDMLKLKQCIEESQMINDELMEFSDEVKMDQEHPVKKELTIAAENIVKLKQCIEESEMVNDELMMDLSDSQLMDFEDQAIMATDQQKSVPPPPRPSVSKHPVPLKNTEATVKVKQLTRELSQLNAMLLKAKSEMKHFIQEHHQPYQKTSPMNWQGGNRNTRF